VEKYDLKPVTCLTWRKKAALVNPIGNDKFNIRVEKYNLKLAAYLARRKKVTLESPIQ